MLKIVGILNVTKDSFSDGGDYYETVDAIKHAKTLRDAGASIVEIGPASSNPDATEVTEQEELDRCRPVILQLRSLGIPFGIDSFRSGTQLYGIEQEASMLNDIHGFENPSIYPALAKSKAKLVVMHSIHRNSMVTREEYSIQQVADSVEGFFNQRLDSLLSAGISKDRIIIDPGMGFFLSSNPNTSFYMLQKLTELQSNFGCEVLISVSRKSFLRACAAVSTEESAPATLAAELYAAQRGVDYIRTHDVKALSTALKVDSALRGEYQA
ncbi:UNVERIFIED_CONTAM: hypothetical protein GTU68_004716 [Idotea baltica]|nr:hypothetical protein [Idotea baltica]